ncbi:MAG: hypothetical protein WBD27_14935 [Pyrinomonadaceae bacterium]
MFNERSSVESEKPTVDFGSLETVIANRYANEVLQFRENRRKEEKGHRIEIFESELDLTKVKFGGPETVFSCAYPRRFEAKPALKISAFREDGEKESLDWIKIVEETRGFLRFKVLRQKGVITSVDRDEGGEFEGAWVKPTGWGVARIRIVASGKCEPNRNPDIDILAKELSDNS